MTEKPPMTLLVPRITEGRIMNAGQAAVFLGVTTKRLYWMAMKGLPHRRLGRAMIFDRVAIDEWLRQSSSIGVDNAVSP